MLSIRNVKGKGWVTLLALQKLRNKKKGGGGVSRWFAFYDLSVLYSLLKKNVM